MFGRTFNCGRGLPDLHEDPQQPLTAHVGQQLRRERSARRYSNRGPCIVGSGISQSLDGTAEPANRTIVQSRLDGAGPNCLQVGQRTAEQFERVVNAVIKGG